jgi:G3E family GTPase
MDRRKVSRCLTGLVAKQGQDILRAKGIIDVKNEKRRLVFQAVHMVLEGDLQREWKPNEMRYSRIVFIGRKLDPLALKEGFDACVAA